MEKKPKIAASLKHQLNEYITNNYNKPFEKKPKWNQNKYHYEQNYVSFFNNYFRFINYIL